jgi:hypothetical protein
VPKSQVARWCWLVARSRRQRRSPLGVRPHTAAAPDEAFTVPVASFWPQHRERPAGDRKATSDIPAGQVACAQVVRRRATRYGSGCEARATTQQV